MQTIRNCLHRSGLMAGQPAIHIPFTLYHIQERLDWARQHVGWTLNDWTPVLFTDESKFCIDYTDQHARVWRARNERFVRPLQQGLSYGIGGNQHARENRPTHY